MKVLAQEACWTPRSNPVIDRILAGLARLVRGDAKDLSNITHIPESHLVRLGVQTKAGNNSASPGMTSDTCEKPAAWSEMTFSEKVAWRCNHPDPLVDYQSWVDKLRVKQLIHGSFDFAEPYRVVNRPAEIDAGLLPETFVMKTTHGWNQSLLVIDGIAQSTNRSTTNKGRRAGSTFLQQAARHWFVSERELSRRLHEQQYQSVLPRIIFEQYLDPVDYELQFFLFNGECKLTMVFYRNFCHEGLSYQLYDSNWQRVTPDAETAARHETDCQPQKPPADLLRQLARFCKDIDHVRADFYVSNGRYYFSEFTFTNGRGAAGFIGNYDKTLGRFWLP